jgi:ATP-dependent Clp protease ATP-binding subunit ClpA
MPEGQKSFIEKYGVNFTTQEYVVNPAIGREKEIRELSLVLLTPDKSAILTGKPGTGKTDIVEGLAYLIQRNEVPDALKGYTIIKVDTQALMGTVKETGDSRVQTLIDEILTHEKYILFIDEIHTLINATSEAALDFANMFKTGLGRGDLKIIGATTSDEYEKYILRDKAFTRRFQRIDIAEPDKDLTTKIVAGVIPRIEHSTGIKMSYSPFMWEKLARFVVELTTEYNRVYETAGRYPDVPITIFSQAFSEALFDNKDTVTITDIRKAIQNSKAVYDDVKVKYLEMFDTEFKDLLDEDNRDHEGLEETIPAEEENEKPKTIGSILKDPSNDKKAVNALREITASYDRLVEISKGNKEE